jgi:hypothetical protein
MEFSQQLSGVLNQKKNRKVHALTQTLQSTTEAGKHKKNKTN